MRFINGGLFTEMRSWTRSGAKHSYGTIKEVCQRLLSFPRAVERMRDEGFMTALLLELLDSPCPEGPRLATELMVALSNAQGSKDASSYYEQVIKDLEEAGADKRIHMIALRAKFWATLKYVIKGLFLFIVVAVIARQWPSFRIMLTKLTSTAGNDATSTQ